MHQFTPCVSGLHRNFAFLSVFLLVLAVPPACAEVQTDTALTGVQKEWAHIKYRLPKKQRKDAFRKLYARAGQIRIAHPDKGEALLWEGIILTDYAGEQGGIRALQMIKQSRKLFEKALNTNPHIAHGAVYIQLGNLYFEVPGWPLGFGDMGKARILLDKGLSISPDGLDANYFMGKFLLKQKKYHKAARYLRRALAAPLLPGRIIADTGRKSDARRLLNLITQKLNL